MEITYLIDYITQRIHDSILVFMGESKETDFSQKQISLPDEFMGKKLTEEELIVFLLALLPHISPRTLDPFFLLNKELARPYTDFGGWQGTSHTGFLPTGETAAFLIARNDVEKRQEVNYLLSREHWFYQERIVWLEGQGEGEPWLSGRLRVSDEIIAGVYGLSYEPAYGASFPAKKITTPLGWDDLVLPYEAMDELEEINEWFANQQLIRTKWNLDRIIKPGFRCLFYGPPGTGKTLTVQLLGKQNHLDVYRVDLSMIVSKYIGETEKNLATVFDKASLYNWILFFDEADALFGQRTDTQSSNDRHANQEVAYLLQRIEDFPGIVILATNLKENIDEAFLRRFQVTLHFPMPDETLRFHLWKKILPEEWKPSDELLYEASRYKLAGGNMINVVRSCALKLYQQPESVITSEILLQAIEREEAKQGNKLVTITQKTIRP